MTPLTEDELARPLTAGLESMLRRWETGTATLVGEFGTQDEGEALHYAAVQLLPLIAALRATPVADTAGIDAERLRLVVHDEYEQQDFGCWHKNQYPKTWDCYQRAEEIAAALRTPKPEGDR